MCTSRSSAARKNERSRGCRQRVIGSILPHSAVAQAEERWEAEQERKKKRPQKVIGSNGGTIMAPITPKERRKLETRSKQREARAA